MSTTQLVLVFILFLAAFTLFVFGGMQLVCRGPVLNSLYPDDAENKPDPKPYYRQSGVAMILVGIIMLINAAAIFLHNSKLCWINAVLLPVTVFYVIGTAAMMEDQTKRK